MGSLYGPLPHLLQMSGCGEVFALLVALRHSGATPTVIATDCKMVLDIWNAGPAQDLTNVCFSEVWHDIFRAAEDVGHANIIFVKVKSHFSRTAAVNANVE